MTKNNQNLESNSKTLRVHPPLPRSGKGKLCPGKGKMCPGKRNMFTREGKLCVQEKERCV